MSNNYTKAAFEIVVTEAEAELLRLAQEASDALDGTTEGEECRAAYDRLGPAFAEAFPPDEDAPFAGFLTLFPDPDFPFFDCTITAEANPADPGRIHVFFSGDQFGIEQVANLIFAACKSALPCGFEYANDCDRLRVGEFGGGYVAITACGVSYGSTSAMLDRALRREADKALDGVGSLQTATVFDEVARLDKPIVGD